MKMLSICDLNQEYQYARAFVGNILYFKTFLFILCFRTYFFNVLIYLTKHMEKIRALLFYVRADNLPDFLNAIIP